MYEVSILDTKDVTLENISATMSTVNNSRFLHYIFSSLGVELSPQCPISSKGAAVDIMNSY